MDAKELRASAEWVIARPRLGDEPPNKYRDACERFARHILATVKADDGETTDAECIADAKRWAAKIMPDGKPRAESKYVPYVSGWYTPGNDDCVIDPILMEIDRFEDTEDAAWLALGKLLARLREELNS